MSSPQTASFRIRGLTPTIMNNGRLADPTNKITKAIKQIYSAKARGKDLPDEKMQEMLRLQFLGALYVDDKGHPCWPGENLEAMFLSAAKKTRQGPVCKIAVIVDGNSPLEYDGPKDPEKLWLKEDFRLIVMANRGGHPVLTARPIFRKWELEFSVIYIPDKINLETLREWLETAGSIIGLSDWRPKYGRFEIVSG